MEKKCIAALRKLGVTVIVAPFEADPELAYLCRIDYCQGVLTEDSDVLMYSAACGTPFPILYKYEPQSGSVQVVDIAKLGLTTAMRRMPSPHPQSHPLSPQSQSQQRSLENGLPAVTARKESNLSKLIRQFSGSDGGRMFVQMCLLAGCDYCESVPSVGIVTAQQVHFSFPLRTTRFSHALDLTAIGCHSLCWFEQRPPPRGRYSLLSREREEDSRPVPPTHPAGGDLDLLPPRLRSPATTSRQLLHSLAR